MNVPLLDLRAQYATIRSEVESALAEIFESQRFVLGPHGEALEREMAEFLGAGHAVGMSSGSDALLAALMALDIGRGDEVITSPFTFFSTAGSVVRLGATPVFVDIEPDTCNLDPEQVAAAVTPRTRAILPVHLYGRPCDMEAIQTIARRHGLAVVEDAAQAVGARRDGVAMGAAGDCGCLSFFPTKNLGGAGDGGMVLTGSESTAARLRRIRNHGMEPKYVYDEIGGNFRLDEIQAAVLRIKLRHLPEWTRRRQANARQYQQRFQEAGLDPEHLRLPRIDPGPGDGPPEGFEHVVHQYVVRVKERAALRDHLAARQIGTEVYYPVPLHLQTCFRDLDYAPGSLPESERAATEVLALPIYPELSPAQIDFVAEAIRQFFQ